MPKFKQSPEQLSEVVKYENCNQFSVTHHGSEGFACRTFNSQGIDTGYLPGHHKYIRFNSDKIKVSSRLKKYTKMDQWKGVYITLPDGKYMRIVQKEYAYYPNTDEITITSQNKPILKRR